ncbi:hypothetical protein QFC24_005671 [Naganishia onofrii]|uniref:Uncharacterized protein n=1 Tax=Naganishia onofrii TaxID=1851511 RepID=A0ACC2X5Y1_9TREE|nr:hypothetical protein QFC24_005671 [Naganishia onofrii]
MLSFNHQGLDASATYKPASSTRCLDFERIEHDPATGHAVVEVTSNHLSSCSLPNSWPDIFNNRFVAAPTLSDSATFSSNHAEGVLTPEVLSPPRLEAKVLKSEQEPACYAPEHDPQYVRYLQETAKPSAAGANVKQRIRELREAKTEASIKKAYEQLEAMKQKNEQRRAK